MAGDVLYTLEQQVNPEHTAVILIDVQNDFCHPDGYMGRIGSDVSLARRMVPRLAEHVEAARRVGATVVFVQVIMDDQFLTHATRALDARRGIDPTIRCQSNSWGAELYELKRLPADVLVVKHHYSAFPDTDFDLILRNRGIKTLIMTGVATNVCVESTARDGFFKGYYIVFLSDCTATYSEEAHHATLATIHRQFGTVCTADEVEAIWQRRLVGG